MKRKKSNKADRAAERLQVWTPSTDHERPTVERLYKGGMRASTTGKTIKSMGGWGLVDTGQGYAARDATAHPIDRLEQAGVISKDQAQAGRDFEALVRACTEVGGIRDSITLFEGPKGHESDDGPVDVKPALRQLERRLSREQLSELRRVCVEHGVPGLSPRLLGALREGLNETERFFSPQMRRRA